MIKYIIIFDGHCNVCSTSIDFIKKRDKKHLFTFISMQAKEAQILIKDYKIKGFDEDTLVLIKKEKVYMRAEAILEIIKELPFPWSLLGVFKIFPLSILDRFYKVFAANRYRLGSKTNSCKHKL